MSSLAATSSESGKTAWTVSAASERGPVGGSVVTGKKRLSAIGNGLGGSRSRWILAIVELRGDGEIVMRRQAGLRQPRRPTLRRSSASSGFVCGLHLDADGALQECRGFSAARQKSRRSDIVEMTGPPPSMRVVPSAGSLRGDCRRATPRRRCRRRRPVTEQACQSGERACPRQTSAKP